ncbi:hypothetical protein KFK09_011862 [Dendrobium nobile]|uniref:Uncharacterized protein n=1 Tax=Dendrobium nobile TaxID=94219 RepID=A0A8T3BG83_DENNO|nr:hypothetical protein KFK09_011861 [Dendrobium nobile]KAI0511237.1 hypothetical protein KFK09_011862 [Dendrobium nobile]
MEKVIREEEEEGEEKKRENRKKDKEKIKGDEEEKRYTLQMKKGQRLGLAKGGNSIGQDKGGDGLGPNVQHRELVGLGGLRLSQPHEREKGLEPSFADKEATDRKRGFGL